MAPTGAARHLYPPPGWHSTKLSMLSARTSRAVCPAGRAITAVARPLPPARRPTRDASAMAGQLDKSTPEAQWKTILDATQFKVLRQKGTEPAGSGEYNKFYEDGVYKCAGCGTPLYNSDTKFNSGCGWPAFYDNLEGAVDRFEDVSYGMKRVEITCSNCGGHLGHVFEGEGFPTPTNQRHCVNSVSLKFEPKR